MRKNPERLAWVVLLASFFLCIGVAVAIPLGTRHYILYARVEQNVTLEVQRGPLSATLAGRGAPVAIDAERDEIPEGTIITTESTAGRLVMHAPPDDDLVIATVQLYDNTEVVLPSARSPRFSTSRLPHQVILEVKAGRVRINVSSDDGRPTVVEVHASNGVATLTEGSYEVKVNQTRMEVSVRDGRAQVSNNDEPLIPLGPAQRAIIEGQKITGPLPTARNLVVNGDFQVPLEPSWTSYREQTDPQQPPGSASITTDEGQEVIRLQRTGSNHAEVGIRQEIRYDVRDFTSLELHLIVRIIQQDIAGFGGCGYLGSECPIIVRIDYKDIHGTDREWLHSFYTGKPADDWLMNWWAEKVQPGNWHTYDSGNLMEELADSPPALIKSLTIYASGHNFDALVTEVELLAQE